MKNVFVCRFFVQEDEGSLSPVNPELPFCFPNQVYHALGRHNSLGPNIYWNKRCLHEVEWRVFFLVRKTITKLLNKVSMMQRLREAITIDSFSSEVWYYLVYIVNSSINIVKRKAMDSYLGLSPLLTRVKVPLEGSKEILRFETEEQLEVLRECFGQPVTYGCRNIHPTLKDGANGRCLTENSLINFVQSCTVQSEEYQRSTNATGVDLEFFHNKLRVVVRYETFVYRTYPISREALNCPSSHLRLLLNGSESEVSTEPLENSRQTNNNHTTQPTASHETINAPADSASADCSIYVGDVFFRDGSKYRVTAVNGDKQLVYCVVWKPSRGRASRVSTQQNTVAFLTADGSVLQAIKHHSA